MKTRVKMAGKSQYEIEHGGWIEGEEGYIEGFGPLPSAPVAIIIKDRMVFAQINQFEVIQDN